MYFRSLFCLTGFKALLSLVPSRTAAQIPEHLDHIIYASPFTNFYGGKGSGLAYEYYLNRSKRLSLVVPVSFGFRDYFVVHATPGSRAARQANLPEASNYSFLLHPGIKFYAGKNTSFLSYALGSSTFLSYGTEDGYKQYFDSKSNSVLYRYSSGNEFRWGGLFDHYLNFRISERILMELQGSFGFVHYSRFLVDGKMRRPDSYAGEMTGLVGIKFGCRL